MSTLRLKANAYFNRKLLDDTYEGIRPVIGTTTFQFKQNNKIEKATSKGRDDYGAIRSAFPQREPMEFSWKRDEADEVTLSMATMGESAALSVSAGSVSADAIVAKKGFYVPIGGVTPVMEITPHTVVVTNSAGTTTYIEGTDYSIDYYMGFFMAAIGGAITQDQALKITCDHKAMVGYTVTTEITSAYRGKLILHGINMADDSKMLITIPEVLIVSNSPIDFLSDKPIEFDFVGNCIKLPSESAPYYLSSYR